MIRVLSITWVYWLGCLEIRKQLKNGSRKAASVEPEKANANLEKMVPYENAVQK